MVEFGLLYCSSVCRRRPTDARDPLGNPERSRGDLVGTFSEPRGVRGERAALKHPPPPGSHRRRDRRPRRPAPPPDPSLPSPHQTPREIPITSGRRAGCAASDRERLGPRQRQDPELQPAEIDMSASRGDRTCARPQQLRRGRAQGPRSTGFHLKPFRCHAFLTSISISASRAFHFGLFSGCSARMDRPSTGSEARRPAEDPTRRRVVRQGQGCAPRHPSGLLRTRARVGLASPEAATRHVRRAVLPRRLRPVARHRERRRRGARHTPEHAIDFVPGARGHRARPICA